MVSLSGALTAFNGVASLLGGNSVQIGGVTLNQFEIPEQLPFGGTQKVAVHEAPGGVRVVQVMGAFEGEKSWSGAFFSSDAVSRAQQLDVMRRKGSIVTLIWASFSYQVVITSFICNYSRAGGWLPYSISCVAIPGKSPGRPPTLLGQIASDIGAATGITALVNAAAPVLQTAQSALATVQSVLPIAGALTGGSAAFLSISSAVGSATGVIGTLSGAANNAISVLGTPTALASGASPGAAATAVNGAATATGNVSALTAIGGYLSRIGANLGLTH